MSKMDELRAFQSALRNFRRWLEPSKQYSDGGSGVPVEEREVPGGMFLQEHRSTRYAWNLDMSALPPDVEPVLRRRLQFLLLAAVDTIAEELTKEKQAAAAEEARAVLSELESPQP
jgi:hypothetical protein